jgi:hypothetical protein
VTSLAFLSAHSANPLSHADSSAGGEFVEPYHVFLKNEDDCRAEIEQPISSPRETGIVSPPRKNARPAF